MRWSEVRPLMFLLIGAVSAFAATALYRYGGSDVVQAHPGSVRAGSSCRCCNLCNCPSMEKTCPKVEIK